MLSIDADFEIAKSNNVIFFRHCVKHGIELIGLEWNGMEWNGLDWIGLDWNGMERNMFLFSHYVTNIYAYAWTCVLCTDTVNRPRPLISCNSFIVGLS